MQAPTSVPACWRRIAFLLCAVLIAAPLRAAELPLLHAHAGDASVRAPLVIVAVDDAWRAALPRDAKLATQAYLDRLPKEAVQRSNDYDEGGYWLQLWEVLVVLAVAGLLLQGRRSARLRVWAVRALRRRFGTLHRLTGRVFVLAGVGLALSGLALLLQVQSITTGLLDAARGVFGLALLAALVLGVAAARAHDMLGHQAWMIRAYAIGIGTGPVALVMLPIYLITGEPPMGLAADIVVVGMWLLTIALGEWVVRKLGLPRPLQPVITVTQAVQRRG